MDNETSSDELEEQKCSDLEVPLFTSETFDELVMSHFSFITDNQWRLLSLNRADYDTIDLLLDLCQKIIEKVCSVVCDEVAPQVQSRMCGQISTEDPSNSTSTSVTMNGTEARKRECNYCTVTEEDIQASLGNSLPDCLGRALEVVEETSEHSEKLLKLVSEEVAKRVNHRLAVITQSSSSLQSEEPVEIEASESDMLPIAYHFAKILKRCLTEQHSLVVPDEEYMVKNLTQSYGPNHVTVVEDLTKEDLKNSENSVYVNPSRTSTETELSQEEKTFLAVFLGKLLDNIALSTKMSYSDLDFDGMLENLRRTMGETGFTVPQTSGNLHQTIFKKLCREFGSTELLQAAITSDDLVFVQTVARELKLQLQRGTEKPPGFFTKVSRIFRRKSNKVSPDCEVETSVSNSKVFCLENESTCLQQKKQKRPAVIRMFSNVARVLKKPLTSCCRGASQDR